MQNKLQQKLSTLHKEEEESRAKLLAKNNNLPYVNLAKTAINIDSLGLISKQEAEKRKLVVIAKIGRKLKIGAINPEAIKSLIKQFNNFDISLFIISEKSFAKALASYDQMPKPEKKAEIEINSQDLPDIKNLKHQLKDSTTTDILNIIIAGSLKQKASDVHIEATQGQMRLRFRIDGLLEDIAYLNKKIYQALLSRIKILSKLKLNINKIPQNGRITIKQEKSEIEVRTSTLPGPFGENIVLRILNPNLINLDLSKLGFEPDHLEKLQKAIKKPNGMVLNTGPTGSGKTTTLYACLMEVHEPGIKIITLEDPIEYRLGGVTQTQIDLKKGYTFNIGLKNILRQDPDVILLGEIRDQETASTALNAALTGHVVFSTLHTNNAYGAIPRLIDMGIKPFVIAPAINLIIAQRLVRKKGGGRIGIFELFEIDEEMEKLILSSPPAYKIKDLAIKKGMRTMYEDGMLKVKKGFITKQELEKNTAQ